MATLDLVVNVVIKNADRLNSLSDRMGNIGRNLTLGVTAPLVAAGGAFTAMAAEAEKSQAKLESVFDSTEAAAWTSIDALNAHAEALAKSTTFDDDAVAEAQAALLAFGDIVGEQFTGATDAAADLAAFLGVDISDAATKLGKALADPEAGLGRLQQAIGPLTDEQQKLIDQFIAAGDTASAQQVILDAVSDKIGTVAEDLAATSGGQMTQAMNQLGEAGEAIGTFLLPVLSTLAGWLQSLAGWFTALDPGMQGFIVTIGAVAAAIGPVLLVLSSLSSAFGAVGGAFRLLSTLLLANPFVALIAAVTALVIFLATNWDTIVAQVQQVVTAIGDFFKDVGKVITDVWEGIMDFLGDVVDSIAETGKVMWEPIGKGFDAAIDFVRGIWNAFARFWNGIQISVPSVDIPFIGRVGGFSIGLPDLPMLASGGIVTQPTLALIGESGPEAVIPLDQGFRTGGDLHIHLYNLGEPITQEEDILESLRLLVPHIRDAVAHG